MEASSLQLALEKLRDLCNGAVGYELEALTTKGLRVVKAHKGFLLCDFIVHNGVSDEHGNWHVGAIAMLMDIIGSIPAHTVSPCFNASVDFNISYYSTAKLQEEVELEAKVVGKKEKLTSIVVEVRKKENGELIALGRQWMAATNYSKANHQVSKL